MERAVELAQGTINPLQYGNEAYDMARALLSAVAELERIGPVYEAAVKLVDRRLAAKLPGDARSHRRHRLGPQQGGQAMKRVFQCPMCRHVMAHNRDACPNCGKRLSFEALDQTGYITREIDLAAVFCIASNLAIGAALCRAWQSTCDSWVSSNQNVAFWKPGCGRSAP